MNIPKPMVNERLVEWINIEELVEDENSKQQVLEEVDPLEDKNLTLEHEKFMRETRDKILQITTEIDNMRKKLRYRAQNKYNKTLFGSLIGLWHDTNDKF